MMLSKPVLSAANLNALAKMVSNAGFQRIMFDDNYKLYGKQMKNLLKKNGAELNDKCSFREVIEFSYHHLLTHYRHEYIYKTALLNSYVLKHYSLADTILLNEFKIGNSKADAVLINGTNKVFEIKTELDSPERLSSQLSDYYKAFSEVYIFIHHSVINKYIQLVDTHVGIMTFNHNQIEVVRAATPDQSKLEIVTMMKALRKDEYLEVVKRLCGEIPQTQPVLLFKTCLNVLSQYAVDEVQYEFLKVIKQRIDPAINELMAQSNLPDSLRLSCYYSNLNQNDYLSLIKRLSFQI